MGDNLPQVTIIAGPNGSGKTTFALKYLSIAYQPFLNADEIAKEISPDDVSKVQLKAGKEYFRRLHQLIEAQEDFVFESTLSGKGNTKVIHRLKEVGFLVNIQYLFLRLLKLVSLVCQSVFLTVAIMYRTRM